MEYLILIKHWRLLDSDRQPVGRNGFNNGELGSVWLPSEFMFACLLIISFEIISFVPSPGEILLREHVGVELED